MVQLLNYEMFSILVSAPLILNPCSSPRLDAIGILDSIQHDNYWSLLRLHISSRNAFTLKEIHVWLGSRQALLQEAVVYAYRCVLSR